ncbi:MAG: hypothetical protein Q9227_003063 [Pyrenula ochraceoflavens]
MSTHHASSALDDSRGYTGPLIRGQNPALLLEAGLRDRITDSLYWKEQCFGLNAATLLDRAVELNAIGGTYGVGMKPTPFICLVFKLLTLVPERAVVMEYLRRGGEEFKYLRALGLFYVRLTASDAVEVYEVLEGYLGDYRKLRRRRKEGFELTFVDAFVDELLTKRRVCGTALWELPARGVLEDAERLEPRESVMQRELDEEEEEGEERVGVDGDVEMVEDANGTGGAESASEAGRSPRREPSDDDDSG